MGAISIFRLTVAPMGRSYMLRTLLRPRSALR